MIQALCFTQYATFVFYLSLFNLFAATKKKMASIKFGVCVCILVSFLSFSLIIIIIIIVAIIIINIILLHKSSQTDTFGLPLLINHD